MDKPVKQQVRDLLYQRDHDRLVELCEENRKIWTELRFRLFDMDEKIRREQSEKAMIAARIALLTPREQEVMNLVVVGKANKVIAVDLGLSQKTVEFHRAHIMEKMQAESLAELVRLISKYSQN